MHEISNNNSYTATDTQVRKHQHYTILIFVTICKNSRNMHMVQSISAAQNFH